MNEFLDNIGSKDMKSGEGVLIIAMDQARTTICFNANFNPIQLRMLYYEIQKMGGQIMKQLIEKEEG